MISAVDDKGWKISDRPNASTIAIVDQRGKVVARGPKREDDINVARAIAAVPQLVDIAVRLASGYDPRLVAATAILVLQDLRR